MNKDREALINRFMTDIPLPEGVYHRLRLFADEFITEVEKQYKAKVIKAVKSASIPRGDRALIIKRIEGIE